jgi:hypothetical protein
MNGITRNRLPAWAAAVLSALWLAADASPALALPAPMPAEELFARSDVVATVRVVGVRCVGYVVDPARGERLRVYGARLKVLHVYKGRVRPGQTLVVLSREVPYGTQGAVAYEPGEEVTTYLVWDGADGAYVTTWWNGKTAGAPVPGYPVTQTYPIPPAPVVVGGVWVWYPRWWLCRPWWRRWPI